MIAEIPRKHGFQLLGEPYCLAIVFINVHAISYRYGDLAMIDATKKTLHEEFAKFFEKPTRPNLRELLRNNLGEFDQVDFKRDWPVRSELARHILAFANSQGGIMVVGIAESSKGELLADGLSQFQDKTKVRGSVEKYVPRELSFEILDFQFEETEYATIQGKLFQVLIVEDRPEHLPYLCRCDGTEISNRMVYIRDRVSSTPATHDALQRLLNRRIATGQSTTRILSLREHIDELRELYALIPQYRQRDLFVTAAVAAAARSIQTSNPNYPNENFEQFVGRLIEKKKDAIESFLSCHGGYD